MSVSYKKYHKVRDHFHYIREYRGNAHDITVIFHYRSNCEYNFFHKTYLTN